jgi:AcrR family transcriptional regulator
MAQEVIKEKGKYNLAEAIKRCMAAAPLEAITVRAVCEEAGVSRQTFYRYFLDKYDLVNWYFDKLLAISFQEMGNGRTIHESLVRKFEYIKEERVFFRTAFQTDEQNNLKDHDFQMIFAFYRDLLEEKSGRTLTDTLKLLLEIYCQASIYMTVRWVMNGMKKTPEELAELMIQAMPELLIKEFTGCGILR